MLWNCGSSFRIGCIARSRIFVVSLFARESGLVPMLCIGGSNPFPLHRIHSYTGFELLCDLAVQTICAKLERSLDGSSRWRRELSEWPRGVALGTFADSRFWHLIQSQGIVGVLLDLFLMLCSVVSPRSFPSPVIYIQVTWAVVDDIPVCIELPLSHLGFKRRRRRCLL